MKEDATHNAIDHLYVEKLEKMQRQAKKAQSPVC
jgi:hypothetical protein